MITVAVIAGGKSSRFGEDKLLYPFRGTFVLKNLLESLGGFAEVLVVTKNPLKFPNINQVRLIPEAWSEFSPVYGIYTALKFAKNDKVLILPGDSPLISIKFLKNFSKEMPPAYIVEKEREYPLLALLSKVHLIEVFNFIKEGKHKLRELHRYLRSRKVPFSKYLPFDYRKCSLLNLNRKEDLNELFLR